MWLSQVCRYKPWLPTKVCRMGSMHEQWLPVEEWEGIYEVSNGGRVRRISPYATWKGSNSKIDYRRTRKRFGERPDRILRPMLKDGRPTVCLSRGAGTEKWPSVHTLVALAFIGPRPSPRHSVNHLNGNKADNRVENLEWATNRQQQLHAHANGLAKPYSFRRLTDEQAREIYLDDTISGREWARRLGVSQVTISAIRTGKSYRWATGAARKSDTRTWKACVEECDCRCHYGYVAPQYSL